MSRWVEVGPVHDYPTASWGDVVAVQACADVHGAWASLQHRLAGHPGRRAVTTRYCDRCNREWEWQV